MLVACPECARMVSEKAVVCVSCGYPLTDEPHLKLDRKELKAIKILEQTNQGAHHQAIETLVEVKTERAMLPKRVWPSEGELERIGTRGRVDSLNLQSDIKQALEDSLSKHIDALSARMFRALIKALMVTVFVIGVAARVWFWLL